MRKRRTSGFCEGRAQYWVRLLDLLKRIAETAKANNLKPYEYFEYLLTEIPKHMDDKNNNFLEELLPWSETLPENIRKPKKMDEKMDEK